MGKHESVGAFLGALFDSDPNTVATIELIEVQRPSLAYFGEGIPFTPEKIMRSNVGAFLYNLGADLLEEEPVELEEEPQFAIEVLRLVRPRIKLQLGNGTDYDCCGGVEIDRQSGGGLNIDLSGQGKSNVVTSIVLNTFGLTTEFIGPLLSCKGSKFAESAADLAKAVATAVAAAGTEVKKEIKAAAKAAAKGTYDAAVAVPKLCNAAMKKARKRLGGISSNAPKFAKGVATKLFG